MLSRRDFGLYIAASSLTYTSVVSPALADTSKLVIFAAASLKTALDKIAAVWTAETGVETAISYAGSSALAKQIEADAPADIFLSADTAWMTYLVDKKRVAREAVVNLLGNEIVLIASSDSNLQLKLASGVDLSGLLGDGKLAMADVKSVPAGKYGKAALESLGLWATVEAKVAQAENVRAALKLVSTGEAEMGIVYVTDVKAEPGVKVISTFPTDSYPAIVYPAAVVAASKNLAAAEFLKFLCSAKALEIFKAEGFTVLAT